MTPTRHDVGAACVRGAAWLLALGPTLVWLVVEALRRPEVVAASGPALGPTWVALRIVGTALLLLVGASLVVDRFTGEVGRRTFDASTRAWGVVLGACVGFLLGLPVFMLVPKDPEDFNFALDLFILLVMVVAPIVGMALGAALAGKVMRLSGPLLGALVGRLATGAVFALGAGAILAFVVSRFLSGRAAEAAFFVVFGGVQLVGTFWAKEGVIDAMVPLPEAPPR